MSKSREQSQGIKWNSLQLNFKINEMFAFFPKQSAFQENYPRGCCWGCWLTWLIGHNRFVTCKNKKNSYIINVTNFIEVDDRFSSV